MDGLTKQPAKGVFWKILNREFTTLMSMYINIDKYIPVNINVYTSKFLCIYHISVCVCVLDSSFNGQATLSKCMFLTIVKIG